MSLPAEGRPAAEVLAALDAAKADDVRWRSGRALTLAYVPPAEVLELQAAAYARFLGENALNTDAFPSLRMLQADVVDIVSGWVHGGEEAAGFITSGGTESILLAVRAARERGRAERGVTEPEMVLAESAHAAFEKAADYFGVRSVRVPVDAGWRADVGAMADAVNDRTVLVVGLGAAVPARRHRPGRPRSPRWPPSGASPATSTPASAASPSTTSSASATPSCPGTSGWTASRRSRSTSTSTATRPRARRCSSIARRRSGATRPSSPTVGWVARYGSSGVLGTKSGGTIAVAWAVLQHLGDDGLPPADRCGAPGDRGPGRRASPPSTGWSWWRRPTPRWSPSGPPIRPVSTSTPWPTRSGAGAGTSTARARRRRCTARVNAVHDGLVPELLADLAGVGRGGADLRTRSATLVRTAPSTDARPCPTRHDAVTVPA